MWYCSRCGEGPLATWSPCCPYCGHAYCGACTVDPDYVRLDSGRSFAYLPPSTASPDSLELRSVARQPEADKYHDGVATNPPVEITHAHQQQLRQQYPEIPATKTPETSAITNNADNGVGTAPSGQSSIQTMTIKSQEGHIVRIPVDVQAAPKVSDGNRKRTVNEVQSSPPTRPVHPNLRFNSVDVAEKLRQSRQKPDLGDSLALEHEVSRSTNDFEDVEEPETMMPHNKEPLSNVEIGLPPASGSTTRLPQIHHNHERSLAINLISKTFTPVSIASGAELLEENYDEDMLSGSQVLANTAPTLSDRMIWSQLSDSDDERTSMYAESIFSHESTWSSATGVSSAGGYTDAEVVTATRELVNIFLEDAVTVQLYQRAFDDPRIGADRLQRNLHRLLKIYSQNLHREAQGELERLASQLVAVKARYVAQCVIEKFHVKPTSQRHRKIVSQVDEDSDEEDAEEEDRIQPIDEDRFEDIVVFHQFLVRSAAFRLFQEQLEAFMQPKILRPPLEAPLLQNMDERTRKVETPATPPLTQSRPSEKESTTTRMHTGSLERLKRYSNIIFVAMELLEPPLLPGTARLRWSCVSLYSVNRQSTLWCTTEVLAGQMLTRRRDVVNVSLAMFVNIDLEASTG